MAEIWPSSGMKKLINSSKVQNLLIKKIYTCGLQLIGTYVTYDGNEEEFCLFSVRSRIVNANHNIGLNDLMTEGNNVWLDESTKVLFFLLSYTFYEA